MDSPRGLCSSRLMSTKTTSFFTLHFAKKRKNKPNFLSDVVVVLFYVKRYAVEEHGIIRF